jgi:multiple sugar transport system substrate-binding protein
MVLISQWSMAAKEVTFWYHSSAESNAEVAVIREQIAEFNRTNAEHTVKLLTLPEGSYDLNVFIHSLASDLPDLLDFDGPNIANYVWMGHLQPLDDLIKPEVLDNLLPSIRRQGLYPPDQKIYSVGTYDSGLALWGNKQLLEQAGVRIPTSLDDAWEMKEFEQILAKLAKSSGVKYPLDMKLNYGQGEWFTYGLSPLIQSMGGDLIDRREWKANGRLDSEGSIRALRKLQTWKDRGWILPADRGDTPFYQDKNVALSFVGHWMWDTHKKALGDDLVLIPMPKFGQEHITGMGSWNYGISRNAKNPEGAAAFLEFLLEDEQVLKMTNANGAIPATKTALQKSEKFASPGAPLYIYAQQLQDIALNRPNHPAYPTITNAFSRAVADILMDKDVAKTLNNAALAIDDDIIDTNGYYPFIKN